MFKVLSQIHDVLSVPSASSSPAAEGPTATDSAASQHGAVQTSSPAAPPSAAASGRPADALQLPPEVQDVSAGQFPATGANTLHLNWDANTTAAQKIEQLRWGLEQELGEDKLVLACR